MTIFFEFDENTFAKRLQVLTEYIRRTNAQDPTPDVIGHVSDIFENTYIVSFFNTTTLTDHHQSVHDDRIETFDFLTQQFKQVETPVLNSRLHANTDNLKEFIVTTDEGENVAIECPQNFHFDYTQLKCVPAPPCHNKAPGFYPLNERLLDRLVLGQQQDRDYSSTDYLSHPTLYLNCLISNEENIDNNNLYNIQECPDNHTFDPITRQCIEQDVCTNKPDGYIIRHASNTLAANQFVQCHNGRREIVSCPETNQIFDQTTMTCVETHPCAINGAHHTYTTDDIGSTQFFKCLNNQESQLITCINRIFNMTTNMYECRGDAECTQFPNGTGELVYEHNNDDLHYNSGRLVCKDYSIVENIECDQSNVFENKLYWNKFMLNLDFPRKIFDGTQCITSYINNTTIINSNNNNNNNGVTLKRNVYGVQNIPNHYDIDMQTSMVMDKNAIVNLLPVNRADADAQFANGLIFARQLNALGLNPTTGETIECFGSQLYDVFDGTRANICDVNGKNVTQTIEFSNGAFLNVLSPVLTADDTDYRGFCAIHYENEGFFVDNANFTRRILTNILHTDICTDLYTTLYQKYTTLAHKYTTPTPKYTYTFVKEQKNIIEYGSNTQFENATISENAQTIAPLFNPFIEIPSLLTVNDWVLPPAQLPFPIGEFEQSDSSDIPPNVIRPEPTEPTLQRKYLYYLCHYEIPLFKMTSCLAQDEIIIDALADLRNNIQYDTECASASGLANILNAYVYLGNDLGCRSVYDENENKIKVIRQTPAPLIYNNLQTQSNDNVFYNKWIHVKNNQFMACPPDLYDHDSFTCNVETDKLYYLDNMQEENVTS